MCCGFCGVGFVGVVVGGFDVGLNGLGVLDGCEGEDAFFGVGCRVI